MGCHGKAGCVTICSFYYAPGTLLNVQDVTGYGNLFSVSRRQNPTPGNIRADAIEHIGAEGPGKVGRGLLLPTEPWEDVGCIFLGCERLKEQMRLVLVALGS